MKVAVLGCGLAGLSASYHLNKKGINPFMIEKENEVGGLARTIRFGDFLLDFGPHRLHSEKGWIIELSKDLLGDELIKRKRMSKILFQDRYIDYPLKPDAMFSMGRGTVVKVMRDYISAQIKGVLYRPKEKSLADWVTNRFGNQLYQIYFKGYNEKIWGIDPSELSAEWASQRVDSLSMKSVIKNMMKMGKKPRTFLSEFYYPKHGIGRLSEAFERNIKGRLIKGSSVRGVSRTGDLWKIVHDKGSLKVDKIINTIPVKDFIDVLDDVPDDIRHDASQLEYRNSIVIFLLIDQDTITDDNWIYYHSPDLLISRVSQQKNFSPFCCPDGKTALTCEIFTDDRHDVWGWPEDRIISSVIKEIVEVGLLSNRKKVIGSKAYKLRKTYPLYRIGVEERVENVLNYLKGRGVVSTGRQGSFYHTNMDHSIEMGVNGAEEIFS